MNETAQLEGKPNITVTDESLVESLSQVVEKMKLIYNPVKNDPSYNPENFQQTTKAVTNYINLNLLDKSKNHHALRLASTTISPPLSCSCSCSCSHSVSLPEASARSFGQSKPLRADPCAAARIS